MRDLASFWMGFDATRLSGAVIPALLSVAIAGLNGCTMLGPQVLKQGRPAYNAALAQTNSEQNLAWVIRTRYGLPPSQLAVSSITASMNLGAGISVNRGFGPRRSYEANLVPLSADLSYDQNPTISYVPVDGDPHIRALMSPIPLDLVILLLSNADDPRLAATMLLKRLNRISNPAFMRADHVDPRFERIITLLVKLVEADKLAIAQAEDKDADSGHRYVVWIHDYRGAHAKEVQEFLRLLDIRDLNTDGEDITLPLIEDLRPPGEGSIAVQTRSVYELGRIAASTVDIPPGDRRAGLAIDYPPAGAAGTLVEVRRAPERPAVALVATRFRDWWYYIAGNDPTSKEYFRIFNALMSVRIAEATQGTSVAPILTVPVSR